MENVNVRNDLNEMVKTINFREDDNYRYGRRAVCKVRLFNDYVLEFVDKECGLYDLIQSLTALAGKNSIKSVRLVEKEKKNQLDLIEDVGDDGKNTFVCVLFTLSDDSEHYLFPARKFTDRGILDNYYSLFKLQKKNEKKGV